MKADGEGFLHPNIDLAACSDCGLCRKICPVNSSTAQKASSDTQKKAKEFPTVWAAWNLDAEIRRQSSSGGVFSVLAENVFNKGGVVVGAAFDKELVVRHCIIETPADLYQLRGAKYVQSEISPVIYREVRRLLKEDRTVLFSGTPCQVAGIRSQVKRGHDRLYCCDIACHGVPSPLLLRRYVKASMDKGEQMVNILFRDKSSGWKRFRICWQLAGGNSKSFSISTDPYMLAFLRNIALRLSCYTCKFTNIKRQSDLTMADFWGVGKKYPEYDENDEGTSLVLVNSKKGQVWLDECRSRLFLGPADIDTAIAGNPVLIRSVCRPPDRDTFYNDLDTLAFNKLVRKYQLCRPPFHRRAIGGLKRRVKSVITRLTRPD